MAEFLTRRLFPGPVWLHFLFLGAALYGVLSVIYPEPKPTLGPPNAARLAVMAESYAKMVGGLPSETDVARFIDLELRDELLFREALARQLHLRDRVIAQRIVRNMRFLDPETRADELQLVSEGMALNMHLTDEFIRRRLVQVMTQLLVAGAALQPATDQELLEAFESRRETFLEPARVSFSHVFLGEVSLEEAAAVLDEIESQALSPETAIGLGRAFLSGFNFANLSWTDVGSRMGREFTEALQRTAETGEAPRWLPPLASVYGMHLVYLHSYDAERPQKFDEVVDKLRWDLKTEREEAALQAAVETLMSAYEVKRS